ncbi:hypothetical protein I4U23_015001 [Adineta vaga]|nr:hypothetical protein I4U23_015001 [Adineta vaga]
MSEIPYTTLNETISTPRESITTLGSINTIQYANMDTHSHLCRICRNKLQKKQDTDHTPFDCLTVRCEMLEAEGIRLKDHDMKSRIQIKELETKLAALEEAVQGLTAPKQQQAAPFSFSSGQKVRNPFKKAQSIDVAAVNPEINYDNILPPKRSGSRERVGLFGSLGATSQVR